ncbi:GWxTD domain-containing protein [Nibrella viscosa]
MRFLPLLSIFLMFSACASNKKTQQTQTAKNAPRPTVSTPMMPAAPSGEYTITAIKGKFLSIDSTSARVFLNIYGRQPSGQPLTVDDLSSHFLVNYVMYADYNNRERLGYGNVPLSAQVAVADGDHLTLTFDVKKPANATNAVLLTEISETSNGKKALNDLPIRFKSTKLSDRFSLYTPNGQLPQLKNYVNVNDTLVIRDVAGTSRQLYLFRYKHDFDPAQSPMNTSSRPAPKSLAVDTAVMIMTNQPLQLAEEGLYFFVEDTTDAAGIGLVAVDKRFPRITRPEKLIRPVLYMSTSQEINELNNAPDAKKALDRYWLSLMSGNEEVARRAIRAYYNRVEEANKLFTSYKEGWKTDKGMIYIILGPPDRVQRSRDREVWVYTKRANVSEINFTFNKRPNQFVEDHYELVRYVEYQPIWYPIVEAWRTGAIRE